MKRLLVIPLCLLTLWGNAQMNPQSKKITEKYFPDPSVEISTPAFFKQKGFTSYDEMIAFINTQQSNHSDLVSISYIGASQKGKQIPLVHIEKKNCFANKVKVWFQACLHGDEPASTEGMLYLLDKLLNDPVYSYLLDRLEIVIVPMANIDGNQKMQRVAANGLDLNRDQTKLMAPESRVLKKAFSDYNAEVAVDFHEYQPYRRDYLELGTFGVVPHYDVMMMYSCNLNVPQSLRDYTKTKFVDNATRVLDENNMTHHEYFTSEKVNGEIQLRQGSSSARSSATSYALANSISSLIEIRGGDLGRTSLKRRVYSIFLVATSYLQTAYDNVDEVKTVLKNAQENPNPEVVVKTSTPVSKQKITFIDLATNDLIDLEVKLSDACTAKPTLTRTRPFAYILLPNQGELAEKLKILGLQVNQLDKEVEFEVENYVVTEFEKDATETEGTFMQKVKTITNRMLKRFPEGSYIVYLNQPKSNLAVEVLEPEAPNSFVSFSVLKTGLNQELPIYRYLEKTPL